MLKRGQSATWSAVLLIAGLVVPATALALTLRTRRAVARTRHATVPSATSSRGTPQIGALYSSPSTPMHTCTASVVASSRGNLLMTAAHCVSGNARGMVFVPGERGGRAPYGRWTVTAAYLAPSWVTRQDPDADVAFLTVAPQTIGGKLTEIQQVTGAYAIGREARRGELVTVTGYPAGIDDDPISCTARIYMTDGFPTFECHGYVDGTSGSPWVLKTAHGPVVVGVIGGRHQGGCVEYRSYSPPLNASFEAYHRATSGATADTAPSPEGDGC
ncbi:MAG TPA: trypsin-like peptidase domain-containing protein [Solirubrobacteraceae bacterium]|nr:trypsin-like peptidase domain-containing protein [Solirubrobacteraceae bacterium]